MDAIDKDNIDKDKAQTNPSSVFDRFSEVVANTELSTTRRPRCSRNGNWKPVSSRSPRERA